MEQTISDEQRRLNKNLHSQDDRFGNRADGAGVASRLPAALSRMHELGICSSVIDYGTGKGKLVKRLRDELSPDILVHGYDPAVDEFSTKPTEPADILVCLDVLEHIEMETIDAVLNDIKKLTKRFCFLVIDLQPAVKLLSDGRNAHILLAPTDWWVNKLGQLFPCITSFPVYHVSGLPQKLVIACSHDTMSLQFMYGFLNKLRIYNLKMGGGVLAKRKNKGE